MEEECRAQWQENQTASGCPSKQATLAEQGEGGSSVSKENERQNQNGNHSLGVEPITICSATVAATRGVFLCMLLFSSHHFQGGNAALVTNGLLAFSKVVCLDPHQSCLCACSQVESKGQGSGVLCAGASQARRRRPIDDSCHDFQFLSGALFRRRLCGRPMATGGRFNEVEPGAGRLRNSAGAMRIAIGWDCKLFGRARLARRAGAFQIEGCPAVHAPSPTRAHLTRQSLFCVLQSPNLQLAAPILPLPQIKLR